uniref:NADH-ubiquinone oxidoreductase chain 4 n=1 Tax=Phoronis psammophila TaxID=67897 RepID=Q6UKF6_9BILA|nr:NADH dehydrogenase subunit 4 [Phoronis architecta]
MLKLLTPWSLSLLLVILYKKFWETGILMMCYVLIFLMILFYSPLSSILISSNLFLADSMSMALIILSSWIFILMMLASWSILLKSNKKKEFYLWAISLILVLILSFSFNNALFFYFSFEASLVPIMMMILGWGYQPERLQASFYLILYTVGASLPLLAMLLKIYFSMKSLNFFYLATVSSFSFSSIGSFMWILIILAFLVSMPMFLFHLWLPKAHVEAPVAGSMILAGVLLKLGSYGFLRVASIFPMLNISFFSTVSSLSLWGAVITSLICLRQVDMKALIAYSSVGHMGLLLAGSLSGNFLGWESSLLMMLAHGVCSSGLFMLVNLIYEKSQNRSLFLTKGLLNLFPWLTLGWFLLSIINMAAPPSVNLASELLLVSSVISCCGLTLVTLGLISFLAAAYSLFIFTATSHGKISAYLTMESSLKAREYLNIMMHFIPLNIFIFKLDILMHWL